VTAVNETLANETAATEESTPVAIKAALGLPAEASEDQVVAAAEHLHQETTRRRARRSRLLVAAAIELRLVRRTNRRWAEAFAARDPEAFRSYLEIAPREGFPTALEELIALVRERCTALAHADALERVAFDCPELIDEVRRELTRAARRAHRRARVGNSTTAERAPRRDHTARS